MSEIDIVQAQSFVDGEWIDKVTEKPEQLTFQQYIFMGTAPSKRDPEKGEIVCPVCSCAGREQVLDDRVRIYHPSRLIPCRAPEGYEPVLKEHERLVPA